MKRTWMMLVPAALAATVGLGLVVTARLPQATAGEADPRVEPPLVQIATARPAEAAERAFTGLISARVQSNLGFRVQGKIIERLVDVGQTVRAGQPLLRLDPKDLELALAARDNAAAAARAQLVQATSDEARYRQLLADGWAARQKYDQVRATLDTARAQAAAAEAQAKVARNETGYAVLLADADGTIVETLAEPGQVVAAGQPVVRLAHAGPREALVSLPETVRPAIGSPARAVVYGGTAAPSPARLRQLSDAADPATRTYEARYVLDGDAARAPLGATVTVSVPAEDLSDAAEIPLGAVHDDGRTSGVWVFDPDSSAVSFRPVQVRRLAAESAVVFGVGGGERVVALGAHLLHQGERVRDAGQRVVAR